MMTIFIPKKYICIVYILNRVLFKSEHFRGIPPPPLYYVYYSHIAYCTYYIGYVLKVSTLGGYPPPLYYVYYTYIAYLTYYIGYVLKVSTLGGYPPLILCILYI